MMMGEKAEGSKEEENNYRLSPNCISSIDGIYSFLSARVTRPNILIGCSKCFIHRGSIGVHYSRRCAETSVVKACREYELSLALGIEIGYVVKDAKKREVDTERDAP
jgi:hypothetical protein